MAEIVEGYVEHHAMPKDPLGDALHLALASYHKCDFLLTWNCVHLANANKFAHIKRINALLGLFVPSDSADSPAGTPTPHAVPLKISRHNG